VKIRVERSGGLTGIMVRREMDADKLTSSLRNTAERLMVVTKSPILKKAVPKGASDYLNYKITIEEGTKNRVIECNQFDMNESLRSLIKFIETNSKKES
jgi:hypothetical protein